MTPMEGYNQKLLKCVITLRPLKLLLPPKMDRCAHGDVSLLDWRR